MRTLLGLVVVSVVVTSSTDARAQGTYAGGSYARPYAFKDEPLMSINRSYLGYSNFVYPGPGLPAHANPPGRVAAAPAAPAYNYYAAPAPRYAPARTYAPVRRGRLFGWWR